MDIKSIRMGDQFQANSGSAVMPRDDQLHASFRLTAAIAKLPVRTLKNDGEYIRRDSVMDLIGAWLGEISVKDDDPPLAWHDDISGGPGSAGGAL